MNKTKFQELLKKVPPEIKRLEKLQNEIALQISTALKNKGIRQKEFAKNIGMKESQLSKILSGNANLTIKTIAKIEVALGEDIIRIPLFIKQEKEYIIKKIHTIYSVDKYSSMKWSEELSTIPSETGSYKKVHLHEIDFQKLGPA